MAQKNICAGCRNPFQRKYEFLKCSSCDLSYDLECASVTFKRFKIMDTQQKNSWKCPECKCKQPKVCNANTPVRSCAVEVISSPEAGGSDSSNITFRSKKQIKTPTSPTLETVAMDDPMFRGEMRDMIKREISSVLRSTIKELVEDQLKDIRHDMIEIRDSMTFMNGKFEEMKRTVDEKCAALTKLIAEKEDLKSAVHDLSARLNIVELHMRECNVEINGIPEHKSENLVNTLLQLSNVIKNPVNEDDIHNVTRVAKLNESSDRPRAVVAKFRNQRIRDSVLAAVSVFNKQNPQDKLSSHHLGVGGQRVPVFVAEHLTPAAKKLHAAARKKAKEVSYKFVWPRWGRIYVRKDENSPFLLIKSHESLNLMR